MCIFAYGQTGSGKTHTMAGSDVEGCDGSGINFRALDDLFSINEQRRGEVTVPTSALITPSLPTYCTTYILLNNITMETEIQSLSHLLVHAGMLRQ